MCLVLVLIWKKAFSEALKAQSTFLLLGRRMLGLSSSHNYKEVVNSEFTKLDFNSLLLKSQEFLHSNYR